jgi:hypothetical protein
MAQQPAPQPQSATSKGSRHSTALPLVSRPAWPVTLPLPQVEASSTAPTSGDGVAAGTTVSEDQINLAEAAGQISSDDAAMLRTRLQDIQTDLRAQIYRV